MKPKIISHRGNLYGPSSVEFENSPDSIKTCIGFGYFVEIDLQKINETKQGYDLVLGHENHSHIIWPWDEWYHLRSMLYVHCKNEKVFSDIMNSDFDFSGVFFHEDDPVTLTSKGELWFYPTWAVYPGKKNIWVLPERYYMISDAEFSHYFSNVILKNEYAGICTDYPVQLQKKLEKLKILG